MARKAWPIVITAGAILAAVVKRPSKTHAPLGVAPAVDLSKYAGKWHEIARLPNPFQKKCASSTTATYTLRPDGKIGVLNQCRRPDGSIVAVRGTARIANPAGPNTKLKVTFQWPFSGDYWILDIDPDYRWALVGEPARKYLWILSRQPNLEDGVFHRLLDRAKRDGFDVSGLLRTPQTPEAPACIGL